MNQVNPNELSNRRPCPRGRQRWYLLLAAVLCLLAACAVTIRASGQRRAAAEVLAPTDPSVPVRTIQIPETR